MLDRCIFFHYWGKWQSYVEYGVATARWGKLAGKTYDYSEKRQKRECKKCGYIQDEEII